jgi:hypothetical protein
VQVGSAGQIVWGYRIVLQANLIAPPANQCSEQCLNPSENSPSALRAKFCETGLSSTENPGFPHDEMTIYRGLGLAFPLNAFISVTERYVAAFF